MAEKGQNNGCHLKPVAEASKPTENVAETEGKTMTPWEQHSAVISIPRFDYNAPSALLHSRQSGFLITCTISENLFYNCLQFYFLVPYFSYSVVSLCFAIDWSLFWLPSKEEGDGKLVLLVKEKGCRCVCPLFFIFSFFSFLMFIYEWCLSSQLS